MGFWGDKEIGTKIALIGRSRARGVQKKIVSPSNVVDERGRMIPRCWRSGYVHGGALSELLAWIWWGRRPADSSIKVVPS
jgi:hypothetical protein